MPDYRLERECRTPYSEAYFIVDGEKKIGRVDIHYTPTTARATLCVEEGITKEAIHDLIEVIDEELVVSSNVAREDFIITVYQGREVGVYTSEILEEEEEQNGHRQ